VEETYTVYEIQEISQNQIWKWTKISNEVVVFVGGFGSRKGSLKRRVKR